MWNSLSPPPPAPLIPGDGYLGTGSLGTSSAASMWPTKPYIEIITQSTNINFSHEMYNYFMLVSNVPITFNLSIVPVGYIVIIEYEGAGTLNVLMDGLSLSSLLTQGTYLIAKFTDFIRYVELTNPTML